MRKAVHRRRAKETDKPVHVCFHCPQVHTTISISLDKVPGKYFSYFSMKTYVVGTH